MTNKEAIFWLNQIKDKYIHGGDESFDQSRRDAIDEAIKALENSSHIIDALEKLKDETLDGIVKFGIEKSIECVREIEEEQS